MTRQVGRKGKRSKKRFVKMEFSTFLGGGAQWHPIFHQKNWLKTLGFNPLQNNNKKKNKHNNNNNCKVIGLWPQWDSPCYFSAEMSMSLVVYSLVVVQLACHVPRTWLNIYELYLVSMVRLDFSLKSSAWNLFVLDIQFYISDQISFVML